MIKIIRPYLLLLGKILFVLHLAASYSLLAAEKGEQIIAEQTLDFGSIAVGQKKGFSTLTISPTGETQSSNQIHILQIGHPAEFSLLSYPPNTVLIINATIVQTQMNKDNNDRGTIKLIKLSTARTVTTDGTGFASITVGGTLKTSGPITNSAQGADYQAQIALDIHY